MFRESYLSPVIMEEAGHVKEALKGTEAEEPERISMIPAFSATVLSRKSPMEREKGLLVSIGFHDN